AELHAAVRGAARIDPSASKACSLSASTLSIIASFSGGARIVGTLARNGDVVGVALAEPRGGDAEEARLGAEFLQVRGADIAHRCAEAARELVQHAGSGTLVGHLPLDPLGHHLE